MKPGEIPAILQKGEVVLPRNFASKSGGAKTINLTVNVEGANGDQHVIDLVNQGVTLGIKQATPEIVRSSVGAVQSNAKNRPGYLR